MEMKIIFISVNRLQYTTLRRQYFKIRQIMSMLNFNILFDTVCKVFGHVTISLSRQTYKMTYVYVNCSQANNIVEKISNTL